MKIWRIVTYLSVASLLLCLALVFSTPLRFPPLRFPGYIILPFSPVLAFLIPAAALCALLVARLFISHRPFGILIAVASLIFALLTAAGRMASVVLAASLIALVVLFIGSTHIQERSTKASTSI